MTRQERSDRVWLCVLGFCALGIGITEAVGFFREHHLETLSRASQRWGGINPPHRRKHCVAAAAYVAACAGLAWHLETFDRSNCAGDA